MEKGVSVAMAFQNLGEQGSLLRYDGGGTEFEIFVEVKRVSAGY